jgi:hypothetical protein
MEFFNNISAERIAVLLLLSVSWLFIYFGFRGIELIARKVLVTLPFYLRVWHKRRKLKMPKWRQVILGWEEPLSEYVPKPASIGEFYGSLDVMASRIRSGDHWVTKLLPNQGVVNEVKTGVRRCLAVLDSDHALLRAVSPDKEASVSGMLTFVGNPRNDRQESLNLLLRTLKYGRQDTRELALFHVGDNISTTIELKQLEAVVSEWTGANKHLAEKVTDAIRRKFPPSQG